MASKKKNDKRTGETELADKLLAVLDSQRQLGGGAYPPTLGKLVEIAGERPGDSRVASVVVQKTFSSRAFVASAKSKTKAATFLYDSPVVFTQDIPLLASSDRLLEHALKVARKGKGHAFTVVQLRDALTGAGKGELQRAFQKSLQARIEQSRLPSWIGWFWLNNTRYLLRREDIHGTAAPPNGQPQNEDFAAAFDAAFSRINQQNGSRNFLKLYALRQALPQFSREQFDAGLRQLRIAGRYSLDSAEGRSSSLASEEVEAGIREAGSLLTFVSRT